MTQLGGSTVPLNPGEIQLNRSETLEDTARVVSRFLDGIVIRTFAHAELEAWAAAATIPVINGLSDFSHPCQILADLLTIREVRGDARRASRWPTSATATTSPTPGSSPPASSAWTSSSPRPRATTPTRASSPRPQRLWKGRGLPPRVVRDPAEAAAGADFLYTDVWTSMGQETRDEAPAQGVPRLPDRREAAGAREARRRRAALPAGAPRRGDRRRGHRRAAVPRLRAGGEPAARAEGAAGAAVESEETVTGRVRASEGGSDGEDRSGRRSCWRTPGASTPRSSSSGSARSTATTSWPSSPTSARRRTSRRSGPRPSRPAP